MARAERAQQLARLVPAAALLRGQRGGELLAQAALARARGVARGEQLEHVDAIALAAQLERTEVAEQELAQAVGKARRHQHAGAEVLVKVLQPARSIYRIAHGPVFVVPERADRRQRERAEVGPDTGGEAASGHGGIEACGGGGELEAGSAHARAQLSRRRVVRPDCQHAVALHIGDEPAVIEHGPKQHFQVAVEECDRGGGVHAFGERRVAVGIGDDAGSDAFLRWPVRASAAG